MSCKIIGKTNTKRVIFPDCGRAGLYVADSIFMEMTAKTGGGAIMYKRPSKLFTLLRSFFYGCTAHQRGGAISVGVHNSMISMCCFKECQSLTFRHAFDVQVPNNQIYTNEVNQTTSLKCPMNGGNADTFARLEFGVITFNANNFSRCSITSCQGPFLDIENDLSTLLYSTIADNQGGRIGVFDGDNDISKITIFGWNYVNNSLPVPIPSSHQFLYLDGTSATFDECVFADNTHYSLFIGGQDHVFSDSYFCSNGFSESATSSKGKSCTNTLNLYHLSSYGCVVGDFETEDTTRKGIVPMSILLLMCF